MMRMPVDYQPMVLNGHTLVQGTRMCGLYAVLQSIHVEALSNRQRCYMPSF